MMTLVLALANCKKKDLRSDLGHIGSADRKYLAAAIGSVLVRPANSIAEQNGLSAMFSVVVDEMKHEGKTQMK